MKKKLIALVSACALLLVAIVGGTFAYLQDTAEDVNVMTMGNVYIEQHEYERVVDENGDFVLVDTSKVDPNYGYTQAYKLQEFTQAKPALPAVYDNGNGTTAWDPAFQQLWNQVGAPGSNDLFAPEMKNVVDKFVFVENTGKSDAYYRTLIAIEAPEDIDCDKLIHTSLNANSRFDYNDDVTGSQTAADANCFYAKIDGVRYLVYVATYTEVLKPGEVSRPSFLQVYLDPTATNEDCEKFGETWEVLVFSQAVQAAGFADADTALDAAFGDIDENTPATLPWNEVDENGNAFKATVNATVSSKEDLKTALQNKDARVIVVDLEGDVEYDVAAWAANGMGGEKVQDVIINGNGHTITFYQTDSDWNNIVLGNSEATLTIRNANITNAGHNDGPWNRHDLNFACNVVLENVNSDKAMAFKAGATLKNVVIDDANTSDTYAIWIQPNGQTVTLDNVTIDMLDCTDGRGIKIDEQYVSDPAKVTLNVSNTTFKTEEKAAIIVKSAAGAEINIVNVNIAEVAADSAFHVWVDEASEAYADLVIVNGANKIVEGTAFNAATNDTELTNAINNATAGDMIVLNGDFADVTLPEEADGLTIIGVQGATVGNLNLNESTNVVIDGVTFDAADATTVYSKSGDTGYVANITGSALGDNNGAKNIIIRNCTFTGTPVDASKYAPICFEEQGRPTSRATNITVDNCVFECNAFNYIRMNYLADGTVTITNNVFGGENYASGHNTFNFTGNAADITITGNTIYNWNVQKNAIGTSRQGTNDIAIVITDNVFSNSALGNEGGIIELKSSYTKDNCTVNIANNTFEGALTGNEPIITPYN